MGNNDASVVRRRYEVHRRATRALARLAGMDPRVVASLHGVPVRLAGDLAGFVILHGEPALDLARAGRWAMITLLANSSLWYGGAEHNCIELTRGLLALSQRKILKYFGYPSSGIAANAFAKLAPASCSLRSIMLMRRCLDDPRLEVVLAHLPRINWGVLQLLQSHPWGRISPRLLNEVALSRDDDRATRRSLAARALELRREVHRIGENPDQQYLPAAFIIEQRLRLLRSRPSAKRSLVRVPADLPGRIERLVTAADFRVEGTTMENCVGRLWREASLQGLAYFRVLEDHESGVERSTACLSRVDQLNVTAIRGVKNMEVSAATRQFVQDWIAEKLQNASGSGVAFAPQHRSGSSCVHPTGSGESTGTEQLS